MEWREQSTVSCENAFLEARRWVEEVTKKRFGSGNFRSALEDGVLLCDLINKLKPGIVKKVNRLSTPIAGLDNVNVFLKACGKLGLKEAQLFHPGDLQDLSSRVTVRPEETSRRLKNVLITIYWLGRKAQVDPIYNGPYLNLKAFEGLLGLALSKALEESATTKANVRDSGFGDSWYAEKEEPFPLQPSHRREDSLDSLDSESRTLSIFSDATLKGSSEGCGSDAEAELGFKMTEGKDSLHYRRSLVVEPKVATQFNQFLPTKDKGQSGYVPAPLRKKRAERHEDSRRSWASPMYTEDDGTFTRSKSMSDIAVDPAVLRQVRYEELQKIRAQAKDNEDQWQDDLTKWKNRRRSVNSDIVKKKEEREQIEQISSSGSSRRSRTFKEMQDERKGRDHSAPTDNSSAVSEPTPQPRSRTLPPRSYTVDSLYMSSAAPPARENRSPVPTPEPGLARTPTPTVRPRSPSPAETGVNRASPTSRNRASPTGTKYPEPTGTTLKGQTSAAANNWTSHDLVNTGPTATKETEESLIGAAGKAPAFRSHFGSLYKHNSTDTTTEAARVSASLPRSYQRLDSARLTSVVTARPFGTQSTRISSLPRTFAMDDKRLNGETGPQKSAAPSRYGQFMTEDEVDTQVSQAQSSEEEEEEEEEEERQETVTPAAPLSSRDGTQLKPVSTLDTAPESDPMQDLFCDMRISLNQKPNSGRDFGFQADWDSTGPFIKSVQEGSPAELCQLRVGDEVLAVSGRKVSEMSREQWKGSVDAALQKGCLVMDIRRHGNSDWGKDQPSLPYKSHKTINLTSMDPTLVGPPEKYVNICREFTSQPSSETTTRTTNASSLLVKDLVSKGVNGGPRDEPVTMRNKGGSESPMSDVPFIGTSSNRWSWDPEDERRRQEKWQKEQERLLQEKYKRDQEKMDEEWRRDQQEVQEEKSRVREVAPPRPWAEPARRDEEEEEEEERREAELEETNRREMQEQLQRAEERQRRAEEMRLQRKREAELAEQRQQEEEEMKRRQEAAEEQRQQEEEAMKRRQEAAEEQRRQEEEAIKRRQVAAEEQRRYDEMRRRQEAAEEEQRRFDEMRWRQEAAEEQQRRFDEEQHQEQEKFQEQW